MKTFINIKNKLTALALVIVVAVLCMAAVLETTLSQYETLYQNVNVAGAPDTTLLSAPTTAFVVNAISDSTNKTDLLSPNTDYKGSRTNNLVLIFSHGNGTGDADGTTSVFELWGQAIGGPRQPVCTIALTGGKAELVAGTDDNTWVDTAVVTPYHATAITVTDSATDRVVSVSLDITGYRYLQGLFTGAGSTSIITTAYYRYY